MLFAAFIGCVISVVMSGSGQALVAEDFAIEATAVNTFPTVRPLLRAASVDGRDLLVSELGMKKRQRDAFLSRSSVLARINSPGFWKALRGLRIARGMSSRQIFTLVTNGIATKLESADFMSAFNTLFDRFTSKQVVTLMSDSVAAGLEHPRFMTAFNALFDRFTSKQVVTLMSNSVAARLEDPRFMTAFNALFDRFTSMQAVTLIKGPVIARSLSPIWSNTAFGASERSDQHCAYCTTRCPQPRAQHEPAPRPSSRAQRATLYGARSWGRHS